MKNKKFKNIGLKDFLVLVPTKKDLHYYEICFDGIVDETQMLEDFCKSEIKKSRFEKAWNVILDSMNDKFQPADMTYLFTEETLNFLIDNNIELISLGHLQLSDYWLRRIYEKDNRCEEALQTIKKRNITGT